MEEEKPRKQSIKLNKQRTKTEALYRLIVSCQSLSVYKVMRNLGLSWRDALKKYPDLKIPVDLGGVKTHIHLDVSRPTLTKMQCPSCKGLFRNLYYPHPNDPKREQTLKCKDCHQLEKASRVCHSTKMYREVLAPLSRIAQLEGMLEVYHVSTYLSKASIEKFSKLVAEREELLQKVEASPLYSLYRFRLGGNDRFVQPPPR